MREAVHVDLVVARIAGRQNGVVSRGQLLAAGLTRSGIAHRIATGRLHRVHDGVYLLGHAVPAPLARETAAVLACGAGAVLSHRSAAALWGLMDAPAGPVDVTVVDRDARRRGIAVHRTAALGAGEVRRRQGLPLTSPARTLIDLAEAVDASTLESAVAEATARRLVRRAELTAAVGAARGRRGAGALHRLLAQEGGPALTRSEAERRLLRLVRAAGLPAPSTNVRVGPYELDAFWPAQRLAVEVDGFAFHSSRAAFERDRARDAHLQTLGVAVMRITWRQLVETPELVVARIAQALARAA